MTRRHSGKVIGSLNRHVPFHVCAVDRVLEKFASDHWTPQKRALAAVSLRCTADRHRQKLIVSDECPLRRFCDEQMTKLTRHRL